MDIVINTPKGREVIQSAEALTIIEHALQPYIEIQWIDEKDEMQVKVIAIADLRSVHVTNE